MEVGSLHLRSELHVQFGGNPRAGICPTKSGLVLIFSDPASGKPFGYDSHDYLADGIYHYTGEGRVGDQLFVRGNKAILQNRELLLFSRVDQKTWRFVGEVRLAEPPFLTAKAPDQKGLEREVIVFRLKPVSAKFALLH
jgi:hypothetical protein